MAFLSHNNTFLCNAFMISSQHALTAAYCLNDFFLYWPLPNFDEYSLTFYESFKESIRKSKSIKQVECLQRYDATHLSSSFDAAVVTVANFQFLFTNVSLRGMDKNFVENINFTLLHKS